MRKQASTGSKASQGQTLPALDEQQQYREFLAYSSELMEQERKELRREWGRRVEIGDGIRRAVARVQQEISDIPGAHNAVNTNGIITRENMLSIEELSDLEKTATEFLGKQRGILIYETPLSKKRIAVLSLENLGFNISPSNEILRFGNIKRMTFHARIKGVALGHEEMRRYAFDATGSSTSFTDYYSGRYYYTIMPYPHEFLEGLPILKRGQLPEGVLEAERERLSQIMSGLSQFFNDMAGAEITHVLRESKIPRIFLDKQTEAIHADGKGTYPIVDESGELKAVAVSSKFHNAINSIENAPYQSKSLQLFKNAPIKNCNSAQILRITRDTTQPKYTDNCSEVKDADLLVVVPMEAVRELQFGHEQMQHISQKIAGLPVLEETIIKSTRQIILAARAAAREKARGAKAPEISVG